MQTTVTVYPLQNYSFGSKDRKVDKDQNLDARMQRLKTLCVRGMGWWAGAEGARSATSGAALGLVALTRPVCVPWPSARRRFERDGMRRSVEGLLLVQEHNHPHILLLQTALNFFKLPGGRLRPGEDGEVKLSCPPLPGRAGAAVPLPKHPQRAAGTSAVPRAAFALQRWRASSASSPTPCRPRARCSRRPGTWASVPAPSGAPRSSPTSTPTRPCTSRGQRSAKRSLWCPSRTRPCLR